MAVTRLLGHAISKEERILHVKAGLTGCICFCRASLLQSLFEVYTHYGKSVPASVSSQTMYAACLPFQPTLLWHLTHQRLQQF